ncbi:hypothetical protein BFJ72_g516 [Fusarium proliferatum]|uniref:Major facilitator superfamily (MFS) profile domain-containing protein n=1 Tax=Gibberella intermedia TaxID=948311 RepID=A0A420UB84_GIBIN|nr:hypothetical protein BFJ72_g516 [Fusarium proliferatum]
MGGFTFGFDSGIIATTFGHQTFRIYMYGPSQASKSLAGAIVSCYNAGQAIGAPTVGYLADRFSRKYTIALSSLIAILGAALQACAAHVGMMIAGRLIAGLACGQFLAVVPVYITEVAKPSQRGFLVGFQGLMTAIGFCIANWADMAALLRLFMLNGGFLWLCKSPFPSPSCYQSMIRGACLRGSSSRVKREFQWQPR